MQKLAWERHGFRAANFAGTDSISRFGVAGTLDQIPAVSELPNNDAMQHLITTLQSAQAKLVADISMYDTMYTQNAKQYRELKMTVLAGKKALADFNANQLPALEAEAAAAYRQMAEAARQDGIELALTAGYQDAAARQSAYEAAVQSYREAGSKEEDAAAKAATVQPAPEASEYATGYAADILAADSLEENTGFADTRAYEWLSAYAAEYGFILRWPQERQAATGMVFEPWHWRYVGRDNALAIRASGLSLEEYLALEQTK